MDLSVVIVNYNTCALLERCLKSLRAEGLTPEILVVDNASTDGSPGMVRERFPEVCLIESATNRGFAGGNNLAFPHCRGRYVMLLNSDTEVEPGALDAMVQFCDATPDVGALGPRLLNPDGTVQASGFPFPTLTDTALRLMRLRRGTPGGKAPFVDRERQKAFFVGTNNEERATNNAFQSVATFERHDWITGACLMVRREVLERVGPLDEQFFFECEDVDWCRRIRAAGWEIALLPEARVMHHGAGSGIAFSVDALRGHLGACRYFRKYHGRGAEALMRILFTGFHMLGYVKYSIRFQLRRQPGDRLKQQVHWRGIGHFWRAAGSR